MTLNPSFQVRLFCQGCTTRIWHMLFLNIKTETGQRPVNWNIKANLTRRNSVFKLWRKGNCDAQTWCCLEEELNRYVKIWAVIPTCLDIVLSRMSWILLSNLCTSELGITLSSEAYTKATVSTSAALVWNISSYVSKVACAGASMPVWNQKGSDQLISLLIGNIQSDVIQ